MLRILALLLLCICHWDCAAQSKLETDTVKTPPLDTSIVRFDPVDVYSDGDRMKPSICDFSDFRGVSILSGKKYNLLVLDQLGVNLAENNGRQIFAKVPGITAMEMDGSGVQLNIASRGLNPHRSMEFNVNQNGINLNSDLFGYPEVHYNPPMEAIARIEVVQGSAALQFGPQYGGMINYIVKSPDVSKVIGGETNLSVGSFGLMSSYTALGGQKGKWRYFGFFNYRGSNGWRPNSRYDYFAGHGSLYYAVNNKTSIGIELSKMSYRIQLPGGLTELQYATNPRLSVRQRNYYSPDITIPAFVIKSDVNAKTSFLLKSYFLQGQRNSVAFIASPLIADSVNTKLGTLNPRQVDRDFYHTFTTDLRLVRRYWLFGREQVFTTGYKFSRANTKRQQFGKGTVNSDYDITLVEPGYGVDLLFRTVNHGVFVENLFRVNSRWSISPGLRYDNISSRMTGDLIKYKMLDKSYNLIRNVLMKGVGTEFKLGRYVQLFSNYSNAYHPVLHSDLIPSATLAEVDPHMKDSKGYNYDLGLRGNFKDFIRFDVSYFRLFYGNRIGSLTLFKSDGTQYLYRTNIGDALNTGFEAMLDVSVTKLKKGLFKNQLNLFGTYALNHARYLKGSVVVGKDNVDIAGKTVEDVPEYILRSGATLQLKKCTFSVIYSKTGQMFSDASNTVYNATGITGLIPSFHVIDLNVSGRIANRYLIKLGVNNVENNMYFNRRVNNYLGPGILSAPGRSLVFSVGMRF